MNDEEQGPKTPNRTGSWLIFTRGAAELARRLEHAAFAKKHGHETVRDPVGAGHMLERAWFLRWMSEEFEKWPHEPEKAAVERTTLHPLLTTLVRISEEDFLKMPSGPWSAVPSRGSGRP